MDKEAILKLSCDALYAQFVDRVLTDPFAYKPLVSELKHSERFASDFIFRIHVQTAAQFIEAAAQNHARVIEAADDLIERALVLELYEVLNLNYHILAIACKQSGYFERALECFMNVLKYERLHGLKRLTSIVYYYIGEIYLLHDDEESAIEYINLAFRALEETRDVEPRYNMKKLIFTTAIYQLLYQSRRYDEMDRHIEVIRRYCAEDGSLGNLYSYRHAMMFHHFARREFEQARRAFCEILDLYPDADAEFRLQQTKIFCALAREYDLPPSFFEKEILAAEKLGDSKLSYINYALNDYLYAYYAGIGDRYRATEKLRRSFESIEEEMHRLKRNAVNSFKQIQQNFSIEENISSVQKKNSELKLIAAEAVRNRNLAQSTLNRLAIVNELGKKLTHSLDVQGIIDTVYKNLSERLPLHIFLITVQDRESNMLRSLVFYDHGKLREPVALDADTENSAFVRAFKTNRRIQIDDYHEETQFHRPGVNLKDVASRSVLLLPLSIENEVVGVCSVQHSEPHIYKKEHIEFLEDLMPYLAIALNNAFKSAALEKEVTLHIATQNKLRQANQRLKTLSYLDGLTQISNRRDFESRVLEYLQKSKENRCSISIFMFDIDHFKRFNDTYGHLQGDEALKAVASIVRRHFEEVGGISARFGGEEFVAACLGLDEQQSIALGETIRTQVLGLGLNNENTPLGKLSISVGIAHSGGENDVKKSTIMRWADISLYHAKSSGKNRVVLKSVTGDEEPPEGLE